MVALKTPLQVLVVDDDTGVVQTVSDVVRGLGHSPHPAECRAEAIEVVQSGPVHFSILDVHVRADSGLRILDSLRSIRADLPAIFMSGDLTPEIVADAMNLGVRECLDKPLDVAALREAIRTLIALENL